MAPVIPFSFAWFLTIRSTTLEYLRGKILPQRHRLLASAEWVLTEILNLNEGFVAVGRTAGPAKLINECLNPECQPVVLTPDLSANGLGGTLNQLT